MQINKNDKLCFFNSTRAWGGGEKWHFDMALRLHKMGYNILFIANKKSALAERLTKTSVPTLTFSIGNLSFLNLFKLTSLKRMFIREKVAVLVMNLSADVKAAGISARWGSVKRIIYRRGSAIPIKDTFLNRYLFGKILTDVIANSEATKNTVNENNPRMFPKNKIRVIYNGLHLENHNKGIGIPIIKKEESEIILGHLGRMVYQKAHEYLIEVAIKLKAQNIKFRLLLGGKGPLEEEIRSQVISAGLENHVEFLGFIEDVTSFMESIDIFLLPSRWEGFGFVLAEAMVAKKPIVAFNISSNPELVKHGVNGFMADPFNIDEFAGYLITLIKNPVLQTKFGDKGHEIVHNKFTFEKTVENFVEMIYA